MRGLEVQLNGERFCVAGIADGILNAIINVLSQTPSKYDMHMRIGGMEGNHFLLWREVDLHLGDEITFRVVEKPSMEAPSQRKPNHPSTQDSDTAVPGDIPS